MNYSHGHPKRKELPRQAHGSARDDLLLLISQQLDSLSNHVTSLETWQETTSINQVTRAGGENVAHQEPIDENQVTKINAGAPRRFVPRQALQD